MAVTEQPQTSLYEAVIDDAEVEALLEERQNRKDAARAVSKRARDADAAAKERLERLGLGR